MFHGRMDLHKPSALTPLSRISLSIFHQTQYPSRSLILSLIFLLSLCLDLLRVRNNWSQVDFYQRENYLALIIPIVTLKSTYFQWFSHTSHFHFSQFGTVTPWLSQRDVSSSYHVVGRSKKGFYSMKGFMWREIAYRCFIVFATSLEDKNERECLF